MSVPTITQPTIPRRRTAGARIGNAALACIVFLGGFVFFEPAPYELMMIPLIVLWATAGLKLNHYTLPLIGLLFAFAFGGILSVTQMSDFRYGATYMAVTIFLIGSSIFYASVVAERPEERLPVIMHAYIASAVIVSIFGMVTFFDLVPGSEAFKLAGRAKATFQDPNVFGPFLALPFIYVARRLLTRPLRETGWDALWFLIIAGGIFFAFSRAAWGLTAVAFLLVALLAFLTLDRARDRVRLVGYFIAALIALPLLVLGVITLLPAVGDLLQQRAQLVQYYDAGQLGRFERIIIGFSSIPDHPLGLGPLVFGHIFGEDEHNTWLKGFTTYGWIGGLAYITLALWTLAAAFPLLFRRKPWTPVLQAAFAVLVGHLMIHMVIDNDHWRHLYLVYGLIWGIIAAERSRRPLPAPALAASPIPRTAAPAARRARVPRARPAPAH